MKVRINIDDQVFSRVVRHRAGWKCERCTAHKTIGDASLHASHFIGRANRKVRFDFENVDALCYGCHQFFETHKQDLYRNWKIKKLGKKNFDALIERSRKGVAPTKQELVELRKVWRQELKTYYDNT